MRLTYFGQSCFLVEFGGKNLLFDPFITANPLATDIDIEKIDADYILVSHAHQDHTLDVEAIARRTGAIIVSNFEIASHYAAKGFQVAYMNHGGKQDFDFGSVKYVHAVHSSTFADGSNGGNPGGFVVWNKEKCFYFAGDTALTMDMKLIPMTCPSLQLAILPIGDVFTMGVTDALIAAQFVEVDTVVGCHYDTFDPIKIDKAKAEETFENGGKKLLLPSIGASIDW